MDVSGGHFDPDELERLDKAHVWHPFTDMVQYQAGEPVVVVRGRGVRLQDSRGRWYYDGTSSLWLNVHGHAVEAIDRAVAAQLAQVAHSTLLGQGSVPSILLAARLVRSAPPGLTRVFFSDSGATAVEVALKIAIQYWWSRGDGRRRKVLGFTGNYHGDTLGAMAVAPDELFHQPFLAMLPENPRAPYPHCYRCPLGLTRPSCATACLDEVEAALRRHADELAAVIVEPAQGAGGIIPSPPGWLRGLRALCDRHRVLLIVDEVATGFGRTGPRYACEAEGVAPDLLCLGKGLSGGYLPVAATLATETVFEAFLGAPAERRTFFHGHSYTGNALGCAAALASADLLDQLLPLLPGRVRQLAGLLAPLRDEPFVGDVRQAGLMAGVELVADRESRLAFPWEAEAGWAVCRAARARGMLIRPLGSVVVFMPPLVSTEEELADMAGILRAAVRDAGPALRTLAAEARTRSQPERTGSDGARTPHPAGSARGQDGGRP